MKNEMRELLKNQYEGLKKMQTLFEMSKLMGLTKKEQNDLFDSIRKNTKPITYGDKL